MNRATAGGAVHALTILLVDDHPLWRRGVATVLRGLPLAARVDVLEAGDGPRALGIAEERADLAVVLLDLAMRGMDGLAVLLALRRIRPALPVVMLTASETPADMRRCMAAGASGYLPKAVDAAELADVLRRVLAGGAVAPASMGGAVEEGGDPLLTQRQREVLALMCGGLSNKQISLALDLAEKTTKAHISAIFRALGVVNRTQAVLAAQRAGARDA